MRLLLIGKNKKFAYLLIVALIFLLGGGGFFTWQKFIHNGGDVPKEEKEKLEGIEKQIAETQKRLEEVSRLSPEEIKKREEERRILTAQRTNEDVSVAGVEVIVQDGAKSIINKKEGYRIDVPSNLIVARTISSDRIELHDRKTICEDPSCEPTLLIRSEKKNPEKLSLDEWFSKEEKAIGRSVYSPREQLTIRGQSVFKVREEIPLIFDGFYYYWSFGESIYSIRVSSFDAETYRSAIETFSFEHL